MSFTKDNKLMSLRILLVLLLALSLECSFGQHTFHRNYPPVGGKNTTTVSSVQLKSGNYAIMELQTDKNEVGEPYSDTLIISTFKAKGDLDWSKAIYLGKGFKGFTANGTILQAPNDSIYFSIFSSQLDKPNILIGSIGNGGRLGYLRSYGNDLDIANGVAVKNVIANDKRSLYNGYSYIDSEQHGLLSRKNFGGNTIWSKKYDTQVEGLNVDENIASVSYNLDTTLLVAGTIDSNFTKSFLMVTDTLGKIKWSKSYTDDESFIGLPIVSDAKQTRDGNFVMVGLNVELLPPTTVILRGLIIKTDNIGNVIWSKKVVFNTGSFNLLTNMTIDKKGDILVSGVNIDPSLPDSYRFIIKLNDQGEMVWQKKYPNFDNGAQGGQIFETLDGGYGITYTAIDGDKTFSSLIKTDKDGKSSCDLDIEDNIVFDHRFLADTLIWSAEDAVVLSDTVSKKSISYAYDIPVLSLDTKTFCPNEPIDWTFHATIPGATNYKWSTGAEGATLDTLRVMEEGEYSVTVTVGEGVCYMLCDTAKIERYKEPKAALSTSLGKFCENGKLTLIAGYAPGHPNTKSYTWSTGDKDIRSIEIANPGKYSVTIVDQCNEVAIANIDVGAFPTKITSVDITNNVTVDCKVGTISGTLSAQGNSTGLGSESYKWSTGENTTSISLNNTTVLTYTVTATDACGNTASSSTVISLVGKGLESVSITKKVSDTCTSNVVMLNAVTNVFGNYQYKWSSGETTPNITPKKVSTYTITVTDLCGNSASAFAIVSTMDLHPPYTVKIESDTSGVCSDKKATLLVNASNMADTLYLWSTGEKTKGIETSSSGTYTVTVTDICGTTATQSIAVNFEAPDLLYANLFFPTGVGYEKDAKRDTTALKNAILYNRTFGPVNKPEFCLSAITKYELYVYNRWGQLLFESDDVKKEWDGTNKGDEAPTETYLYVARYTIFGVEKVKKGSIQLIRK